MKGARDHVLKHFGSSIFSSRIAEKPTQNKTRKDKEGKGADKELSLPTPMRFIFVSALSSLTVPTILKPGEGKTVRMPDTHEPTDTNHSASFTDMQSINLIALRRPVSGKNAKFTIN